MLITQTKYRHSVPTELKKDRDNVYYKHSVPTKSTPNARLAFFGTEDINIRQL